MKTRKVGDKQLNIDTALVLSGGGAKGAYQVGVIKGLLRMGLKFQLITGSSIGAFNGALLAEFINSGYSNRKIGEELERVWLEVDNFLTFNWSGFLCNLCNPANIPSIFINKIIREALCKFVPEERSFSDYTRCQLSVTGTNLNRKKLEIFDFNSPVPVVEAVLASMAFPVAFPAVNIEGDNYIDGGVLSNAPLKEAILWGVRNIYIIFLTPLHIVEGKDNDNREKEEFSALETIEEFIDLASNKLMYGDLERAEQINHLIKLLNRYEGRLPRDFSRELSRLFGLRYGDGKRIIRIEKIAPEEVLEPPGLAGFNDKDTLRELIAKGERDACKVFSG